MLLVPLRLGRAWHLGQPHHDLGECRAELPRYEREN
jgi:hypothetical protein